MASDPSTPASRSPALLLASFRVTAIVLAVSSGVWASAIWILHLLRPLTADRIPTAVLLGPMAPGIAFMNSLFTVGLDDTRDALLVFFGGPLLELLVCSLLVFAVRRTVARQRDDSMPHIAP